MDTFVVSLLSGISLGFVFFLIAAGLSLVMGLMGIINLAHGALFMLGAFLGITIAKATDNLILGVIVGATASGVAGVAIERGFLRQLYKKELEQILVTFGFVYIIMNLHLWGYGPWPKSAYLPSFLTGSIQIGELLFPIHRLVVVGVAGLICLALWWLQDRTKFGAIVRAGMDNAEMASGLGINLTPITILTFFLGSFLAGFAGVVGAPLLGGVTIESANTMLIVALAVVIVGGMGSIQGALVGALIVGIARAMVGTYFQELAMFTPYIAMVVVLLLKPSGLLGRKL